MLALTSVKRYNNNDIQIAVFWKADVLKMAENVNVKITMSGGGEIELELYPDVAPETVSNFKSLVYIGLLDVL